MNFLKYKFIYFTLSAILVLSSLVSLFIWGLQPSIDFTGGTLIEYQLDQDFQLDQVRNALSESEIKISSIQTVNQQRILIKTENISQEKSQSLTELINKNLNISAVQDRFETIGPTLGRELLIKTIYAVVLTALFILGYVAWTFRNIQFGVSAILAMLHDSLILLGSFAILGHFYNVEVDILFVTAVLTTLSFSVHDTVVVYDRIRESLKKHSQASFEDIANKSLTETMSRSINNSMTIIFMLAALLLLGGATIKWFVLALLIGTITGTYSSPFVAVPLLVIFNKFKKLKLF